MLRKAKVQRRLTELQARLAAKTELTAEKVLRDLEAERRKAARGKGAAYIQAALRASELQGKHIGLFAQRRENERNFTLAAFFKSAAGSDLGGDDDDAK